MSVRIDDLVILTGDTYLSPIWAVVIDGDGVDLAAGWTVRGEARDGSNRLIIDFSPTILLATTDVAVGGSVIPTSTVRLYLKPEFTATLAPGTYNFDLDISHPTKGPFNDPYRVTLVSSGVRVTEDVTKVVP